MFKKIFLLASMLVMFNLGCETCDMKNDTQKAIDVQCANMGYSKGYIKLIETGGWNVGRSYEFFCVDNNGQLKVELAAPTVCGGWQMK